ncbi:MAG: hypothetical protein HY962_07255 [Ignavibacteriae bacterium]|nr:hypothetical protein [Ignavibacteriota bacterium]
MRRLAVLGTIIICSILAEAPGQSAVQSASPSRTVVIDDTDSIGTAALLMWFGNDGTLSHNAMYDGPGFEWPRGSGHHLIYAEGPVFGGLVRGDTCATGAYFRSALQPGPILPGGTAADPADPRHHIYLARRMQRATFAQLPPGVQTRLRADFTTWPADLGAPWLDRNNNGRYDPNFEAWLDNNTTSDEPLFAGEHIAWYVSNDLDTARTSALFGSRPLGIEVHTYIWTRGGHPTLENTVFVRHTVINKTPDAVTEFVLGRWTDFEIGFAGDDFMGCDSVRGMMYSYNSEVSDPLYNDPPVIGTILLQGPIEASLGDTALWSFGRRAGYRNLGVGGFTNVIKGVRGYGDPPTAGASARGHVYRFLRGRMSTGPYPIDPLTHNATAFPLSGDPIHMRGWVDGRVHRASDRRGILACSPVTFHSGDTQEVVYATVVAQGPTRAADLRLLQKRADELHTVYNAGALTFTPPDITATVSYPGTSQTRIDVRGFIQGALAATARFVDGFGSPVASTTLFDDGLHGDGLAGDGTFAGVWITTRQGRGVDCIVDADYPHTHTLTWPVASCLALNGPLHIGVRIVSDHLNFLADANPGEDIRLGLDARNDGAFPVEALRVFPGAWGMYGSRPLVFPAVVAPASTRALPYDAHDVNSFLSYTIPGDTPVGSSLAFPLYTEDTTNQCWCDTARIAVAALREPVADSLAEHFAGYAAGSLGWRVVDRASLDTHEYRVTVRSADTAMHVRTVSIEDMTAGRIVVDGVFLPDSFAHAMPLVAGWKLTAGSTDREVGKAYVMYSDGTTAVCGSWGSWFNTPAGSTTDASPNFTRIPLSIPKRSRSTWKELAVVSIDFDSTRGQDVVRYRGTSLQSAAPDGKVSLPFTVWAMRDSIRVRQLNAGIVESTASGSLDGRWDSGEQLIVFSSTYSTPIPSEYTQNMLYPYNGALDILYIGSYSSTAAFASFRDGTHLLLDSRIPVSDADTFLIRPGRRAAPVPPPKKFDVRTLYPHPARSGAVTTLLVDVPQPARCSVQLHNSLGRVVSLLDTELDTGTHTLALRIPASMAAGMYQLVLVNGSAVVRRPMLLLR